jgi:hypothetical protein
MTYKEAKLERVLKRAIRAAKTLEELDEATYCLKE